MKGEGKESYVVEGENAKEENSTILFRG